MSRIELRGVGKSFGGLEVIRGVDLAIEEGEFCIFVGPSGCGKSTLLRLVAGLEDVSRGEVRIGGRVVNDMAPSDRGLAMVFQSYALYPHMTVAQNMSFGLRRTGHSREETARRVAEAAGILQLGALLDRRPAQLSGGQRQRVAIGRAIVRKPQAFLFDEPLSNLDAELRVQMRVELAKLHGELGTTMIYVTHDQVEAMTLADRIVVLRDGRVEQVGTPSALYGDPDNVFVAGFIGSPRMNLFAAEAGSDGTLSLAGPAFAPRLAAPPPPGPLTVGLRPEELFAGHSGAPLRMGLAVEVVENLGASSILHGRLADGQAILVEQRGNDRARPGDRVEVGFDPARALIFTTSGERLR